jgi:subfamily B ATP-binding cassette protein MsbA
MNASSLACIFFGQRFLHAWRYVLILSMSLISALLEGASFAIILLAFSQYSDSSQVVLVTAKISFWSGVARQLSALAPIHRLIIFLLFAVGLQIVRSMVSFMAAQMMSSLSLKIQVEAQSQVYRQIFRFSFPFVNRYRLGDLVEYAKTPSNFIPAFMDAVNRVVSSFLVAVILFCIMLKISSGLTIATLILFSVFGISQRLIIRMIIRSSSRLSEQMADLSKHIIQHLEGMRLIHTYHRHEKVFNDTSVLLKIVAITSKKLHFWNNIIPSVNETIGIASVGALLGVSVLFFTRQSPQEIASLLAFMMLAYRASTRLQAANIYMGAATIHWGSIFRMKEILKGEDKEYIPSTGKGFRELVTSIRFQNVTFRYRDTLEPALNELSFTILKNSVTAIVGPSGSGKSSLLNLIVRLYEPSQGQILVDEEPLVHYELGSWRNALGVISQDAFIFQDTIEANIRFGLDQRPQEQVIEAAKLSGAHDFIMKLSDGYQTQLGERGYKLSGGEVQRIAMARALLKDPQIFILDEATSSLDSVTEQTLQQGLRNYCFHRTVIIVAHRLSTIVFADQIFYIENGVLLEAGRHCELLAKNGKYAYLWHLQSLAHNRIISSQYLPQESS